MYALHMLLLRQPYTTCHVSQNTGLPWLTPSHASTAITTGLTARSPTCTACHRSHSRMLLLLSPPFRRHLRIPPYKPVHVFIACAAFAPAIHHPPRRRHVPTAIPHPSHATTAITAVLTVPSPTCSACHCSPRRMLLLLSPPFQPHRQTPPTPCMYAWPVGRSRKPSTFQS